MDRRDPRYWIDRFIKACIMSWGQHILISGRTGTGKTTVMYWLVDAFRNFTKETLVWFDTMKSDEALTLLTMGPVRFIIPPGCEMEIKLKDQDRLKVHEYEIVKMTDIFNPWKDLRAPDLNEDGSVQRSWINVICLEAYIIDDEVYSMVISEIFTKLIRLAHFHKIIIPLTIFIDEFHNLAPASGHELGKLHSKAGKMIQRNVEKLRSLGIRLIGSTQAQSKIRRGVRGAFDWLILKRGSIFEFGDEPKLFQFNGKWAGLDNLEMVIVEPNRVFSDPLKIHASPEADFYPRGAEIGSIRYTGEVEINVRQNRAEATA